MMSFAELQELLRSKRDALELDIAAYETEWPDARGLGPMTREEAEQTMLGMLDIGRHRPFEEEGIFLLGQILAVYRHAVTAEVLGKPGRWFCINEEQVLAMGG